MKDMLGKKQERVTTAYITAAPHHPINAEIIQQDWNRNGQANPQDLVYQAYAPYQTLPQAI